MGSIDMKTQIKTAFLVFILMPFFSYSLESECLDLQRDVFIKTVIAISDSDKQKSSQASLTQAEENYQNCLKAHIESECLDLQRDVFIKTVIAISDSDKQKSSQASLTQAEENYQNCLKDSGL